MAHISGMTSVLAVPDTLLLRDNRVLWNLLAQERWQRAQSASSYCHQPDVTHDMIRLLATWLMKVCEQENCKEGIFTLAMSYIRICLSLFQIQKHDLQLLGSVCLLLASKMRGSGRLTIDKLVFYTADSVAHHLLKEWELIIVRFMQWNLAVIISHDFLDHILERLIMDADVRTTLRGHSHKLMTLCSLDYNLLNLAPSMISAACVSLAMFKLNVLQPPREEMTVYLASLMETSTDELQNSQNMIESAFSEEWLHAFLDQEKHT